MIIKLKKELQMNDNINYWYHKIFLLKISTLNRFYILKMCYYKKINIFIRKDFTKGNS